jgi:hypothetical protein
MQAIYKLQVWVELSNQVLFPAGGWLSQPPGEGGCTLCPAEGIIEKGAPDFKICLRRGPFSRLSGGCIKRPDRRLKEDKPLAPEDHGMEKPRRHSIKKSAAFRCGGHADRLRNIAYIIKEQGITRAFNNGKSFNLPAVTMRAHIGTAVHDNQHFLLRGMLVLVKT